MKKILKRIILLKLNFVKRKQLKKMIATGDSSFYYLQVNTTALKSIFIIDPLTGEIVYADNSKGKFFSKDDLKDMAKTIEHLAKEENK
jgi:diphthamide synthase subunit DPH2